jgi:hypothetical protein
MIPPDDDPTRRLRWTIYWLLIVSAAATVSGRIASVTATGRDPRTPFLSANDRSRWCTIRALVDQGTYAIDDVIFDPATGKRASGWHTIDLVKHRGPDGREHYYSSKPVLMPTLMAGVYWAVKQATGTTLETHPFYAGRIVLWLCNVPPLILMWWLLARLIDRYGRSDFSRSLAMVAATCGTFLTTFGVTLNNHLHAAVCVTVTVYCLYRCRSGAGEQRGRGAGETDCSPAHFVLAGLFAALTFANELPALAFLALAAAAAAWCDWRKTLLYFAPPALVVVAAMVALNFVAHGDIGPAYSHRHDGELIGMHAVDGQRLAQDPHAELRNAATAVLKDDALRDALITPRLQVNPGQDVSNRYMLWDEPTQTRLALNVIGNQVEIRRWDNWYEYEGTYWTAENKQGVDQGEESRLTYACHCLLGHHGLFSLTPLWLIAFAGMILAIPKRQEPLHLLAAGTLLLSLIVLAFYLLISPIQDRNYGGVTNGLRWMMWFIPLYLITMLPALDRLAASHWGRAVAVAALAVGIFSASYMPQNPWHHPWLFDYWSYLGWIAY